MKPNKNFHKRRPTRTESQALLDMYKKNAALKTLVKVFDLDIRAVEVSTAHDANANQKNKFKNTMAKLVFKNEVELDAKEQSNNTNNTNADFIKLEEGKAVVGLFYGESKQIPNADKVTKKCWLLEVDNKTVILPSFQELTNKLEKVKTIHAKQLGLGVAVQITNLGLEPIPDTDKSVRKFSVMTA